MVIIGTTINILDLCFLSRFLKTRKNVFIINIYDVFCRRCQVRDDIDETDDGGVIASVQRAHGQQNVGHKVESRLAGEESGRIPDHDPAEEQDDGGTESAECCSLS